MFHEIFQGKKFHEILHHSHESTEENTLFCVLFTAAI